MVPRHSNAARVREWLRSLDALCWYASTVDLDISMRPGPHIHGACVCDVTPLSGGVTS